ncbi:MAG: VanZ family protein [Deltaproteobacteria bacterium]|nr:VanZ family protein [Deltaproteobacteria bacterium]
MAWAAVVGYAAVLFFLSSLPGSDVPPRYPGIDKIAHAVLYAGFAYVLVRAMCGRAFCCSRRAACWVVVIAAAYGVTDEWHQAFVPGRDVSAWDWLADVCGAVGSVLWYRRKDAVPCK